MPSTVGGLILFVVFLIPGFLYYVQRRRWVESKSESSLVETARFVSVSLLTNLLALGVFALIRNWFPNHTPDLVSLADGGWSYFWTEPGYLLSWGLFVLVVSGILSFLLALLSRSNVNVKWFAPDIVQTSAWQRMFKDMVSTKEMRDARNIPFVGIDLRDGTYVSGYVDWFSTELDDVADRDLVLAEPIRVRRDGNEIRADFSRLVVSARDILRMYVSYRPYSEDSEP
jgi:hypothetical protein